MTTEPRELTGRVVRLHFRCHAELPVGSFLRVTGSSLWAPGTAASDPTDATPAMTRTEQASFPVADEDLTQTAMSALYTSSVEMVTTPEDYPVWWTRKPVVVILNNPRKTVQHHYYRYLVVSPGGQTTTTTPMMEEVSVSTSNEMSGSTPVMQWEDPFGTLKAHAKGEISAVSLASSVTAAGQVSKADYRNLPYRTVDIDVQTCQPIMEDDQTMRLDRWGTSDDETFRAYRIREAVSLVYRGLASYSYGGCVGTRGEWFVSNSTFDLYFAHNNFVFQIADSSRNTPQTPTPHV